MNNSKNMALTIVWAVFRFANNCSCKVDRKQKEEHEAGGSTKDSKKEQREQSLFQMIQAAILNRCFLKLHICEVQ